MKTPPSKARSAEIVIKNAGMFKIAPIEDIWPLTKSNASEIKAGIETFGKTRIGQVTNQTTAWRKNNKTSVIIILLLTIF
jgi:hypothetical protein